MHIEISGLQAKADVLLALACEPLRFSRGGDPIIFDVGDFEETLVDSRAVDSQAPHLRSDFLGLVDSSQAHVGIHESPIGRLRARLQLHGHLAFLEALFELPHVVEGLAKVVTKTPVARIVPDTQPICIERLIQFLARPVVAGRNGVTLTFGDTVDQRKRFAVVFGFAL